MRLQRVFLVFKGGLLHVPLAPHVGTSCSPLNRLVRLHGAERYGGYAAPYAPFFRFAHGGAIALNPIVVNVLNQEF